MPNSTPDRHERMANALLSLEGLSLGDAFGQCFFLPESTALEAIADRQLPQGPWCYTDDTVMAIAVVETLAKFGYIDRDYLAGAFVKKHQQEPHRGYGSTARRILREIGSGISWQQAASSAFDGMGSMGNGAAMRSAPIGAYFFDDYSKVVSEARAASEVTHAHPDAQAGAIAVAVAAAFCTRNQNPNYFELLFNVIQFTPESDTKSRIKQALSISYPANLQFLIRRLGNGMKLCSFDTVPIALWLAAHNLHNFLRCPLASRPGFGRSGYNLCNCREYRLFISRSPKHPSILVKVSRSITRSSIYKFGEIRNRIVRLRIENGK